jgi:hypothetical protein
MMIDCEDLRFSCSQPNSHMKMKEMKIKELKDLVMLVKYTVCTTCVFSISIVREGLKFSFCFVQYEYLSK